jgi:hypothetical protein
LLAGSVLAVVLAPRSPRATLAMAGAAAADVALGAGVTAAAATVAPLLAFLTAALTLAAIT